MKNLLYILLILPLFFISSCEEETSPNEENQGNSSLYIGMEAFGGLIFHIDQTGEHGLVAALQDLDGVYEWGCYEIEFSGADGEDIGAGLENTEAIVNQGCQTENGGITAAQAALDYEVNGYSDWYLPSKDELIEMYSTIGQGGPEGNIGSFENSSPRYWSSSERLNDDAWVVYFNNGDSGTYHKDGAYRVRIIRSF